MSGRVYRVTGVVRVRLGVAERREELLRAAIEQISARGVAALRIADVAAALGVSNALVLYHFSTKEKLVAAAFTYAAEDDLSRLRKLLGRRTSALRRLRAAVAGTPRPGRPRGGACGSRAGRWRCASPRCGRSRGNWTVRWKAAIAEVIAEGVAAGGVHVPGADGAALRPTALLDGLAVQLTSYPGAVSRAKAQEWTDEALARELGLKREALTTPRR